MFLNFIVLLASIPIGLLISWLARDELIDGFIYIKLLYLISFILMIIFSFYDEVVMLSLGFICIVSYISVLKRFDARWAVKRKR
ncbi:hypothetical protein J4416_03320 [Candidatus Pacearchaeota archaeon]|nr:hypothetical protein [Candidatus Pacearchaeota archaeon]